MHHLLLLLKSITIIKLRIVSISFFLLLMMLLLMWVTGSFAKCNWGLIVVGVIRERCHLVLAQWLVSSDILLLGLRCRAHALRRERHHLLLVLDRLLVQICLVGCLLRYRLIIGLACGNVERLLKILHTSAGTALSLMVRQIDRIVAPKVLP